MLKKRASVSAEQQGTRLRQLFKLGITIVLATAILAVVAFAYRQAIYASKVSTVAHSADAAVQLLNGSIAETVSIVDLVRARGQDECALATGGVLDELVFLATQLKAIVIADEGATCSSSGYGAAKLSSDLAMGDAQYSQANSIMLRPLSGDYSGMGVSRMVDADAADVVALINANTFVSATIDPDVLHGASAAFELDSGDVIVATPGFDRGQDMSQQREFVVRSSLYPFSYRLRVPSTYLDGDMLALGPWVPILVTIICVLASYLVTIRFIMPDRPSDIIKRAIDAGEIQPYFQPIVDLNSGQIESFEVLSRWVKQSGHVVGPSEFIAEVERYDLSPFLLRSLVQQTGASMVKLMDRFPFLRFAFNVAPDAFTKPDFVVGLKDMLDNAGIPGDRVIIEVTERQEIPDVTRAHAATVELQALGIQVGIDDVGTGHNGLSTITAIAPNEIKIDKYFIDGLPDNQRALSMVRMLVRTAHSLGMKIVAEGIENHEQIEALMALKVDYAQGFHIAKPLPADAAIGLFCQQQDHLTSFSAHRSWLTTTDQGSTDMLPQVTANAA